MTSRWPLATGLPLRPAPLSAVPSIIGRVGFLRAERRARSQRGLLFPDEGGNGRYFPRFS